MLTGARFFPSTVFPGWFLNTFLVGWMAKCSKTGQSDMKFLVVFSHKVPWKQSQGFNNYKDEIFVHSLTPGNSTIPKFILTYFATPFLLKHDLNLFRFFLFAWKHLYLHQLLPCLKVKPSRSTVNTPQRISIGEAFSTFTSVATRLEYHLFFITFPISHLGVSPKRNWQKKHHLVKKHTTSTIYSLIYLFQNRSKK